MRVRTTSASEAPARSSAAVTVGDRLPRLSAGIAEARDLTVRECRVVPATSTRSAARTVRE